LFRVTAFQAQARNFSQNICSRIRKNKEFIIKNQNYRNYNESAEEKPDIIFGRNPVLEALKSQSEIDTVFIAGEIRGTLSVINAIAREQGIPVKNVTDEKLAKMSGGGSHQGVAATIPCASYAELSDIIKKGLENGKNALIVACDGIEDPHNLGAIIRTAEAAGADGLIITKRRSASLSGIVYKTSAGAASVLPVARVPNLTAALETVKKSGIWVYGADMSGRNVFTEKLSGNLCIVIGNEGDGISPLVLKKCDGLVSIPMFGQINSLNASVAAGVILYSIVKNQ
jgi:23S rRNA (guanosine2251-2'-O)-methyltransferase